MRPGLFLALLLAWAAPAAAERAVGLEAQGVDPAFALENPLELDVRDELGRPVRRSVIERQLKASQVSAEARAAEASALPQAAAMVRWLADFQPLWSWFGLPRPDAGGGESWALPAGRPEIKTSAVLVACLSFALCTGAAALRRSLSRLGRHAAAPVVLRC